MQDGTPLTPAGWLRTVDGANNRSQDFIAPVPEPGSIMLMGSGLASLLGLRRRRQQRTSES